MTAVFFDPAHPPSAESLAEHRRQHRLLVLVTDAPLGTAEHWSGEWGVDALITADAANAQRPDWRRQAIAAFCRRHGISGDDAILLAPL